MSMAGEEDVSSELSPEISPVWIIEGLDAQYEFLKGVRLCGAQDDRSASVGDTSKYRLRNPVGSGVIATVEELQLNVATAADVIVTVNTQTVDFPVAVTTGVRDQRWAPGTIQRTALLFTASNTQAGSPAGTGLLRRDAVADAVVIYDKPIVLTPGTAVDWGTVTTNVKSKGSVTWRERAAQALEL